MSEQSSEHLTRLHEAVDSLSPVREMTMWKALPALAAVIAAAENLRRYCLAFDSSEQTCLTTHPASLCGTCRLHAALTELQRALTATRSSA